MAAGGDALARDDDGLVVFVRDALPDELVEVDIIERRRDYARAVVRSVLEPSDDRIAPPCPQVAAGCGGCGWQHVAVEAQHRLKEAIVLDALARIGHVRQPPTPTTVVLPATAYRTTAHVAVTADGAAAFHEPRGHRLVPATGCLVAHPLLADLIDNAVLDASAATFRVSAATGQRAARVEGGTRAGRRLPPDVVVGGAVTEVVSGRPFQVSIRSFFQAGPAAAAALGDAVDAAVGDALGDGGALVDLYAGVGLFASVVGHRHGVPVEAVEVSRFAAGDARVNLADLDAIVVHGEVNAWRGPRASASAVVADPARSGLGRPGVAAVVRAGADRLALVSCDPASLARDTGLLAEEGFTLASVQLVDAFPQTPHVEVVSRFERNA